MDLSSLMQHPIIQGPMAGGPSTPALVAAVSNAGGLGSLAASLLSPETLQQQIGQIRALTGQPFLVNLFMQKTPAPAAADVAQALSLLEPVRVALGLPELSIPKKWCEDFEQQFDVLLAERPAVASFTFDILSRAHVERLHAAGILVIGTVTTLAEALAWQEVGADAVCASGIEAGGHRGTFIGAQEEATLPGCELWPLVARSLAIPVIAAGGIMHGADIARALALGAQAVQMGTAFLVSDESGIHPAHKQRLLNAGDHPTRLTRSFSGRYARGLDNRFMQMMQTVERQVPPYPVQNALTGPLRAAAAAAGNTEFMSLWCGTAVKLARALPVAQLMATLLAEMQAGMGTEPK